MHMFLKEYYVHSVAGKIIFIPEQIQKINKMNMVAQKTEIEKKLVQ